MARLCSVTMKTKSRISVAKYKDSVNIMIEDENSSLAFHEIEMSSKDFFKAFINSGVAMGESTTKGLNKIGKQMEHKTFEFEMPLEYPFFERKETAREIVVERMGELDVEGWIPDMEFSNQDSFFRCPDGKEMARTIIRRWVEPQTN